MDMLQKNISKTGKSLMAGVLAAGLISAVGVEAAKSEADVPVQEITQAIEDMGYTVFPIGKDNAAYEQYFTGKSYLAPLAGGQGIGLSNVTFAPGTINHWHIHHKSCQVLVGLSGTG